MNKETSWYEDEVKKIFDDVIDKLNFGLSKYGEHSYQYSEKNLNNVDLLQHLEEELIDTINYSIAQVIKMRNIKSRLGLETKKWNGDGYDTVEN
jgi:hypothetical protein